MTKISMPWAKAMSRRRAALVRPPTRFNLIPNTSANPSRAILAPSCNVTSVSSVAVGTAGTSGEGRPLLLAAVGGEQPTLDAEVARQRGGMRLLIVANIHGGEVEGKEAVLQLLRETAEGAHDARWADCQAWFLPIYNVDGNERIARANRVSQNGPDGGVGERANAAGLDLNRDFVKADAPETRALLQLFDEVDPHLFVDLHTTNGSRHGYHLTYAPSLNPNVDGRVDRLRYRGDECRCSDLCIRPCRQPS